MSVKCAGCGLVSMGGMDSCRRCGSSLSGGGGAPMQDFAPLPSMAEPAPNVAAAPRRSLSLGCGGFVALLAVLGVVAYFFWARERNTPHWRDFSPPDARFTASMPAYPTLKSAPGDRNRLEMTMYIAEVGNLGATAVGFYDLTALIGKVGTPTPPQREKIMDAIHAGLKDEMRKAGGTLVEEHYVTLHGTEGVEAEATLDETKVKVKNGKMMMQVFWAPPDRIYFLMVLGPESGEIYAGRDRFFQSVQIQQ